MAPGAMFVQYFQEQTTVRSSGVSEGIRLMTIHKARAIILWAADAI